MAGIKNKRNRMIRKKLKSFKSVTKKIRENMLKQKPKNLGSVLKMAINTVKNDKGQIKSPPRVIKIPKTGGILPLIPIFAGLSALGALTGGAASVAKAISDTRAANKQLQENQRHNKTMESIAMAGGKGLYLKPYKTGLGLYLNNNMDLKKKTSTNITSTRPK